MDVYARPSAALLAANGRLHQLRAALQPEPTAVSTNGRSPDPLRPSSEAWRPLLAALPAHLGWESAPLSHLLRHQPPQPAPPPLDAPVSGRDGETAVSHQTVPQEATVKLYPDIALGMLRTGGTAVGRVWLLCHHLDAQRCGKLRIELLKEQLSTKSSPLYLCGKRQLRNLLRDGEGVYWTRDRESVWLRSTAKVALSLGVGRLTGWPVALPVAALLGGVGDFRAHLYAAFHSGRGKAAPSDKPRPIARVTLTALSGVGQSSQRAYEARLKLAVRSNFAIGEIATAPRQEDRAWQQGMALFTLRDHNGQQGRPGNVYLAWQLPNSYAGPHRQRPKGRQKRINRQLKDLVRQGMPGNVGKVMETQQPERRYCANGKVAAQQANKQPKRDFYWRGQARNGRFSQIWRVMRQES